LRCWIKIRWTSTCVADALHRYYRRAASIGQGKNWAICVHRPRDAAYRIAVMESPTKDEVSAIYHAFSHGDIQSVVERMSEDVDWNCPGGAPFSGIRRGRDQVREFFDILLRTTRIDQFDVDDIIGERDHVVVIGRERGTVIETGQHFEQRFAHLFTFRGGKVAAVHLFDDSHAVASAFGESTREREALTGPLGVTRPAFSGQGDLE
jgi:ketosteroid isomerase-like protein